MRNVGTACTRIDTPSPTGGETHIQSWRDLTRRGIPSPHARRNTDKTKSTAAAVTRSDEKMAQALVLYIDGADVR